MRRGREGEGKKCGKEQRTRVPFERHQSPPKLHPEEQQITQEEKKKKGGRMEAERREEVRWEDTRGMRRGREWEEDIEGTEGSGF